VGLAGCQKHSTVVISQGRVPIDATVEPAHVAREVVNRRFQSSSSNKKDKSIRGTGYAFVTGPA
jgi:hypothetical protein